MTVASVNTALASTLAGTGLRVFEYVPESLDPPCIFLALNQIDRGTMGRGTMLLGYEAVVFTSRASDRAGMANLYLYAEPSTSEVKSVWAAVDEDRTLGLSNVDANVTGWRALGIDEVAAYGYYGGVFDIQVLIAGA